MPGKNILFSLFLCLILQGCSSSSYSVEAYKSIGNQLKRNYNLNRGDLIVAYDLNRINKVHSIYPADLGNIINDRSYRTKYLAKFRDNYKSLEIIQKETQSKIIQITHLLEEIHHKHPMLSLSKHQYLIRLAHLNTNQEDAIRELDNLDKIISFVPVMIPLGSKHITSMYGRRSHPIKKQPSFHCGLDMVAKKGSKIYASANGIVIYAGKKSGYGNVVIMQHGPYLKTLYAHLGRIYVKKGKAVARGIAIGTQGNTGSSTKDHLHFEIWINDKHVNPHDFIGNQCGNR